MKILVVDDEKLKRMTLRDDLRESNYDTIAVESPLIGLQLLQQEAFDVLVTDLRMPQMQWDRFSQKGQKRTSTHHCHRHDGLCKCRDRC